MKKQTKWTIDELVSYLDNPASGWSAVLSRSFPTGPKYVWRANDTAKALRYFSTHDPESSRFARTVHVFNDSLGAGVAVCEDRWE